MCVKTIAWYKKEKYLNEADIPKEESGFLMKAVEAARVTGQSLAGINTFILWDVLDFTRRTYGQPKQMGPLTTKYCCDHCQSFPLSGCVRYFYAGVGKKKAATGWAASVD